MNDQELANNIVALGVGGITDNRTGDGKEYFEMRKLEHGVWTFDYMLETSEFVRDPRVAMEMIEKVLDARRDRKQAWQLIDPQGAWMNMTKPIDLSHAIIEKCVKLLS